MATNKSWTCTQVNDTEVDIRIDGSLEWRLCLTNRTQDIRKFELARPGLGGNFEQNYRWTANFPVISRTIRSTVSDAIYGHSVGAMGIGAHVNAIMEARKMLMKSNKQYLPRTRA